jgi:hypothetical protein
MLLYILYIYIYIYICSWLSVITTFLKHLKSLTATDLFSYQFLITDYEISYRFVGYRLWVGYMNIPRYRYLGPPTAIDNGIVVIH